MKRFLNWLFNRRRETTPTVVSETVKTIMLPEVSPIVQTVAEPIKEDRGYLTESEIDARAGLVQIRGLDGLKF